MLGEYNKNSANPVHKMIEVLREHAFAAHTYKHTTMGFLEDIEDMPNQFEYAKAFFRPLVPARVHDRHRGRRRDPDEACRWWRGTGADWKPGTYKVDDPAGAATARDRGRARAVAAGRCPGWPWPSTPRASPRPRRSTRPSTCSWT